MLTLPPFLDILGRTGCNAVPSPTHSPELVSSSSSASRRKLAQTMSIPESDLLPNTPSFEETVDLTGGLTTPIGFRLVDMSILHTAVSWLQCPDCTAVDTLELLEGAERQGLASKLIIRCCECNHMSTFLTSSKVGRFFEINRRVVTGLHLIGRGLSDLEKLCGIINMPHPMARNTFSKHSTALHSAAMQMAQESIRATGEDIRRKILTDSPNLASTSDPVDIDVSVDGTWQRRGFSSLYGVVLAIAAGSGKVVDFTVKSCVCVSCQRHIQLDPNSDEYKCWKQKHIDNGECSKNFDGSAKAIECTGAVEIWRRSVSLHNLRYTTFIGDGDSKSYPDVVADKPYGEGVEIVKSDCIGHVQKCLGAALRRKKKECGRRPLRDGKTIGGRGRLTDQLINKLQNYFGHALCNNLNDIEKMHKAVLAILYHRSSSDNKPVHQYCPKGAASWCGWQRDRKNYKHHNVLPAAVFQEIKPIFHRLADKKQLERCAKGLTQNANESINGLIWQLCPKERFVGVETIETAVALAVCKFNDGAYSLKKLFDHMRLRDGHFTNLSQDPRIKLMFGSLTITALRL